MKPLLVLITTFLITLLVMKISGNKINYQLAGKISLSAMLLFTALGHFIFPTGMSKMLPPFVPYRLFWIYFTGVLEFVFAITLLHPKLSHPTAWALLLFFLLLLPANIYASSIQLNYQTGNLNGKGLAYLWFRIPLQVLFMLWVYLSALFEK